MTIAVVPTDPATNPVKLLANCTPRVGPNGSAATTEPSRTKAPANWGSWESSAVTTTQPFSALCSDSRRSGTSLNWAMSR